MLEDRLRKFLEYNPEVETLILAASDGLPIAFKSRVDEEMEETSARAMAFYNNALSMGYSNIREIVVHWGEDKYVYLITIQEDVFLIGIFKNSIPGKTIFYLRMLASEIKI